MWFRSTIYKSNFINIRKRFTSISIAIGWNVREDHCREKEILFFRCSWISGNVDIQSPFVWAVCLRYCRNASLTQRLRSGMNSLQSFLLIWYPSTSFEQFVLYEVYSTSLLTIDYDLWTSSKLIPMPNLTVNQYEIDLNTQFPYDFQFKRAENKPNNFIHTDAMEMPFDDPLQVIISSPNTNGSLFGIPRIPPKQSTHQSPSWDSPGITPINTPRRKSGSAKASPKPSPSVLPDHQWKEEFLERMKSYESQIQSLTALVTQLCTSSTPIEGCSQRDVAVQSEPPSPSVKSMHSSRSPKVEYRQPVQQKFNQVGLRGSFSKNHSSFQAMLPVVGHRERTMIDYSSLRRSSLLPTDVNPVDILKPIFRFIDHQQQKQQRSLTHSMDPVLAKTNNDQTENVFHLPNVLQSPQQQHVTSTMTTGISFISNGVQMQFINQQSSTTTVYPPSQSVPPPTESLPISPPRSENSLSVEVHGLEMKYLEDEQLAAAIEYDQQSKTPEVVDKSLSFGTQEYLQRYGLFTDTNAS